MSVFSRIFIVINLALTLVLVGIMGALLGQKADYKAKYGESHRSWREARDTLKGRRENFIEQMKGERARDEQVQKKLANQESALTAAVGERKQKEDRINAQRKTRGELVTWIHANQKAYNDLEKELAGLLAQLAVERDSQRVAEERWKVAKFGVDQKQDEVKGTQELLAQLERDFENGKAKRQRLKLWFTELPNHGIDPKKEAEQNPPPKLRGRVEQVAADVFQCMISLGKNDGVFEGMKFTVSRGDTYIGLVEVKKLFPTMSSAQFIVEMIAPGQKIQVGDVVQTSFEVRNK